MKVIIIEDELPAADRLQKMILDAEPSANIICVLDSIESCSCLIARADGSTIVASFIGIILPIKA